jgi:hypothetical protein
LSTLQSAKRDLTFHVDNLACRGQIRNYIGLYSIKFARIEVKQSKWEQSMIHTCDSTSELAVSLNLM